MYYFDDLGQRVEHVWRQRNYEEDAFADIAHDLLRDHPPPPHVTPVAIARWLLGRATLPVQASVDGNFGQPPVTVYRGRRFFIDVYYWVDGTTNIHQHGFAGAFHLLTGSSIHGRYTFHCERRVSAAMLLGRLELTQMDLLAAGTTHRILPHERLIHSLFHLECPSVTIVVRTPGSTHNPPSYEYRSPALALDPFVVDVTTIKALQLITMLHEVAPDRFDEIVRELLGRSDLHTSYLILRQCLKLRDMRVDAIAPLLRATASAHGDDVAAALEPVLREEARFAGLLRIRSYVQDPEARLLLAVLRNAPGRETALRLYAMLRPEGDPVERIVAIVAGLARARRAGTTQSVLGVDLDDDALRRLRARLAGDARPDEPAFASSVVLETLLRSG
jgi:hypothetical protein